MKGNAWLAGYLVVTVALLGGAGFFFAKGRGAYDESFSGWDNLSSKIERLEKEVPYPSEENQKELDDLVTAYSAEVNALYESLARYQKPLNQDISDSEFTTQVLAGKVSAFTKFASENKFGIDNKEQFYMGMSSYQSTFPKPAIVPLLNYQLEAIDYLLRLMVDAGVDSLRYVTREGLPGENEADTPGTEGGIVAGQVVQKYPINLRFSTSHAALQDFVNQLANDKEYFFILRMLRVDNSSPDGPEVSDGGAGPLFKADDGSVPSQELTDQIMSQALSFEETAAAFAEKGFQMQREDARIIFGQEKLGVFAVIDVVRFLPPNEVELAEGGDAKKGGNPPTKRR
ncbi:MAG: Amuc_1100 family pilus-like protein [Verrucomicrobiae bacterium]|nr:Amuc_1100 family pilus-like protein [Verrucomicrobiae bacterium]